jgi:phage shock protein A
MDNPAHQEHQKARDAYCQAIEAVASVEAQARTSRREAKALRARARKKRPGHRLRGEAFQHATALEASADEAIAGIAEILHHVQALRREYEEARMAALAEHRAETGDLSVPPHLGLIPPHPLEKPHVP